MTFNYRLFSDTKQQYRELFGELSQALAIRLQGLQGNFAAPGQFRWPTVESFIEAFSAKLPNSIHEFPLMEWRQAALDIVEREIPIDILQQLKMVKAYRNTFSCHMCGNCCRLASSEDDYRTLQSKAEAGDEFARQFTSIFLPYASREAARQRDPEGVAAVLAFVGEKEARIIPRTERATLENLQAHVPNMNELCQDGSSPPQGGKETHFYFCPYLGEDNRCSIYGTEKRPSLCDSYPESPLGFVSDACAWKPWQEQTHPDTLLAHAMLNLCESWSEKLNAL